MRLIDADELTEVFEDLEEKHECKEISINAAVEIIDDAPTVEVYKKLPEELQLLRPCIGEMQNLRPCLVDGKKAYFHRWGGRSALVDPEAIGGNNGVMQWTVAIVEYEDGQIAEVMPCDIRFINHDEREAREK